MSKDLVITKETKEIKLSSNLEVKLKSQQPSPTPTYEPKFLLVGGDNNTDQYTCLTNDNLDIGNWATVSDIFDNFTMFSALTTGASIYFGNASTTSLAFRINVVTATTQSSNLVLEYWNGSAWTITSTMSEAAFAPFYTYGNQLFGRAQSENVRIGNTSGWAQNTENGITAYWFRIRITSTLSANITANVVVRVIPCLEVDFAGFIHQSSAIAVNLPVPFRSTNATLANVYIGSFPMNSLAFTKATGGTGSVVINVQRGIDTSQNVNLYIGWMSPSSGNCKFSVSTMPIAIGTSMFTSAQTPASTETDLTSVITNTPGTYISTVFSLPVQNMTTKYTNGSTDALAISISRLQSDPQDTINDTVYLFQASLSYFVTTVGLQSQFY